MNRIFLSIALFLATINTFAQISGVITAGDGGDYATVPDALNAVETEGLSGNTVIEIIDDYNNSEYWGIDSCEGDDIYTLTIRPEENSSGVTISGSGGAVASLYYCDHVIIDGSPGGTGDTSVLTFINDNTGNSSAIILNHAENSEIKNCKVRHDGTRGISVNNSNNSTVDHCDIATNSEGPLLNGATYGIEVYRSTNSVIKNNSIHDLHVASVPVIYGIEFYNPDTVPTLDSIYNNFIALNTETTDSTAKVGGIYIYDNKNSTLHLIHNSIYIAGNGTSTNPSYGIIYYAYGDIRIKNNILINQRSNISGDPDHFGISIPEEGSPAVDIDYNCILSNGNGGITGEYLSSQYESFNDWQTNTNWDLNSVNKDVEFTDITTGDLHLTGSSLTDPDLYGLYYESINDIDGELRYADSSFMGADQPTPNEPEPEPNSVNKINNKITEYFNVFYSDEQLVIRLNLEKPDLISIKIYDIIGQCVGNIVNENLEPGKYTYYWTDYSASGIYMINYQTSERSICKKIFF